MEDLKLSVFVDESGNFSYPDEVARFYVVTLVLHRQSDSIEELVRRLDDRLALLKLDGLCFHAGPIIRREEGFANMNWELRAHLFSLLMAFLRKAPVKFATVVVDKKYVSSLKQLTEQLAAGIDASFDSVRRHIKDGETVKVYYDCGQPLVTQLLRDTACRAFGSSVEFAQGVRPSDYRLFQLADLICTMTLVKSKMDEGLPMSASEHRFFGGPRPFKRIYLRQLKAKELR